MTMDGEDRVSAFLAAADGYARRIELAARRDELSRELLEVESELSRCDDQWHRSMAEVSKEDLVDLVVDLRARLADLTDRVEGRIDEGDAAVRTRNVDQGRQFRQGYPQGFQDAITKRPKESGRTRGYVKHGYESGYAAGDAGRKIRPEEAWSEFQVRDRRIRPFGVPPSDADIDGVLAEESGVGASEFPNA